MAASYLLRIDDICPTMDWDVWNGIESVLTEFDVKPIVAVIPDNQDKQLLLGRYEPRFWERVRGWQARGWTIGLHGYQHVFQTANAGIMGINRYSEFAGLPFSTQEAKLRMGCEILAREGVKPDLWVAPAHSFDNNTVKALASVGIRTISDGFSLYPYVDGQGVLWVPQQIWRFRPMPVGVWTVCIHYTDHPHNDIALFRSTVRQFRRQLTSYPDIAARYRDRKRSLLDLGFAASLRLSRRARRNRRKKAPAIATPASDAAHPAARSTAVGE